MDCERLGVTPIDENIRIGMRVHIEIHNGKLQRGKIDFRISHDVNSLS